MEMQTENNLVIFIIGAMMGGILIAIIISLMSGLPPIFHSFFDRRYNKLATQYDELCLSLEHISDLVETIVDDYCVSKVNHLDLIALQLVLFNTSFKQIRLNYVYDDEQYRKTGVFGSLKDITFNIGYSPKSVNKIYNDIRLGKFNFYSDIYEISLDNEKYIMETKEGDEYTEESNIINVVTHIITKMASID